MSFSLSTEGPQQDAMQAGNLSKFHLEFLNERFKFVPSVMKGPHGNVDELSDWRAKRLCPA
jgi:hypothetical protein